MSAWLVAKKHMNRKNSMMQTEEDMDGLQINIYCVGCEMFFLKIASTETSHTHTHTHTYVCHEDKDSPDSPQAVVYPQGGFGKFSAFHNNINSSV